MEDFQARRHYAALLETEKEYKKKWPVGLEEREWLQINCTVYRSVSFLRRYLRAVVVAKGRSGVVVLINDTAFLYVHGSLAAVIKISYETILCRGRSK